MTPTYPEKVRDNTVRAWTGHGSVPLMTVHTWKGHRAVPPVTVTNIGHFDHTRAVM